MYLYIILQIEGESEWGSHIATNKLFHDDTEFSTDHKMKTLHFMHAVKKTFPKYLIHCDVLQLAVFAPNEREPLNINEPLPEMDYIKVTSPPRDPGKNKYNNKYLVYVVVEFRSTSDKSENFSTRSFVYISYHLGQYVSCLQSLVKKMFEDKLTDYDPENLTVYFKNIKLNPQDNLFQRIKTEPGSVESANVKVVVPPPRPGM